MEWSPFNIAFFASAGADRRIITWDITKIGAGVLDEDDANDGAAELLVNWLIHVYSSLCMVAIKEKSLTSRGIPNHSLSWLLLRRIIIYRFGRW